MNVTDWTARLLRLAHDLEALDVEYSIGIYVDAGRVATFDYNPIAAAAESAGCVSNDRAAVASTPASAGSSDGPGSCQPHPPAQDRTSADHAEDAGSNPAPRSNGSICGGGTKNALHLKANRPQ